MLTLTQLDVAMYARERARARCVSLSNWNKNCAFQWIAFFFKMRIVFEFFVDVVVVVLLLLQSDYTIISITASRKYFFLSIILSLYRCGYMLIDSEFSLGLWHPEQKKYQLNFSNCFAIFGVAYWCRLKKVFNFDHGAGWYVGVVVIFVSVSLE